MTFRRLLGFLRPYRGQVALSAVLAILSQASGLAIPYLTGRGYYARNPRGQIIGDMSGMIKLIFSPVDKKLLGAHIIGEQASELIHVAAHVMLAEGTIDTFIQAVYNYPTLSDLYKYAAYDGLGNWDKWKQTQPE